jgi:hypothetical protein
MARRLQEMRSKTQKLSWVRVSVKMLGLGIITLSAIFNDTYRMIRPVVSSWAIKTDKKYTHRLNFQAVTLQVLC